MTGLDIVNEIRKLAQEQPDFVYKRDGACKYTSGQLSILLLAKDQYIAWFSLADIEIKS